MKSRLFIKVLGTYLILIILASSVIYYLVGQQIRAGTVERIEKELLTFAQVINSESRLEAGERIGRLAEISKSRITLIAPGGEIIADSEHEVSTMEKHLTRPEIQEARVRGSGKAIRYSRTVGTDMLYVALSRGDGGFIRLAKPLHEIRSIMDSLYRSLFVSILIMVFPSLIFALIFSYRYYSPIKEMEDFTEKLREGKEPGSLLIRKNDELGQLAKNINFLVEELQSQIRSVSEEKGKLIAAFASMSEGVLLLNGDNKIEIYNRAFRKMIAAEYGEAAGKTLMEAFRNIELQKAFESFRAARQPVREEIVLGEISPMTFNISISSVAGLPGGEEKTLIVFHDVTRVKKLERMRVDFVANVTHEIKTPLTAILGFIETLEGGAIEDRETALRFLGIISRHAERMNRLLEDLLTISNIELGEIKFYFESVSLSGIAESVLPMIESRAGEKGLAVSRDVPETTPPVRADRDRLVQILLNVLDNALKFTPAPGRISVSASREGGQWVVLRVADTGVGVPKSEISRLGERFYRVDKTRSRELGGTGLGLSIVKHLMQAHQGKMEIESQLGQGTTVSLYFPVYKE
ncbi:MAG: ATP-binding protein [Syntrophales bacterium]|nr:ATP-binding protein [Syntrophales bacterium]